MKHTLIRRYLIVPTLDVVKQTQRDIQQLYAYYGITESTIVEMTIDAIRFYKMTYHVWSFERPFDEAMLSCFEARVHDLQAIASKHKAFLWRTYQQSIENLLVSAMLQYYLWIDSLLLKWHIDLSDRNHRVDFVQTLPKSGVILYCESLP